MTAKRHIDHFSTVDFVSPHLKHFLMSDLLHVDLFQLLPLFFCFFFSVQSVRFKYGKFTVMPHATHAYEIEVKLKISKQKQWYLLLSFLNRIFYLFT